VDPGPGFYLNADAGQDPWSQINADPDLDPGKKVEFLHEKVVNRSKNIHTKV